MLVYVHFLGLRIKIFSSSSHIFSWILFGTKIGDENNEVFFCYWLPIQSYFPSVNASVVILNPGKPLQNASKIERHFPRPELNLRTASQPRNQLANQVSMRVGPKHTVATASDVCQANSLCKNTGDNVFWREGCTDPTWKSPFCLVLCTKIAAGFKIQKCETKGLIKNKVVANQLTT